MAMSNRWVCRCKENYELEDIKKILETESKGERKGEKIDKLKYIIQLDPQIISTEKINYISGTLFFEDEIKNEYYNLTDDGELEEISDIQKTTYTINFWISSNGIFLFRNSQPHTVKGKDFLSKLLFKHSDVIKNFNYDIESIEKDVISGVLHGMWTICYKDRQGNITSGTHYGENVNNDPMYNQTMGAPRNFIGVEKETDEEIIKITIYRKGTITIFKNFESPTDIVKVFKVIEEFSGYAHIPK